MGSGFKDFAAGDILTANDVDGYLMRQSVMTFADAAARDSALSGVLDEGMVAYLEDTNRTTYYDGASWQDIATSSSIGTYSDYTPTFTNISFSSYIARYTQVNKLVHVWFSGVLSSTVSGTIGITTPTDSKPTNSDGVFASLAHGRDATTGGRTPGQINIRSGNGLQFWTLAAGGSSLIWDATEPFTWASGDEFMFTLTYESD